MAVELGASRLMAHYFSSSQIVWTIIIGTIMIAMALGNIYGGRSVDKNPNPDKLYGRIIIAAIWIALIPVLGKYIILGISVVLIFAGILLLLAIIYFASGKINIWINNCYRFHLKDSFPYIAGIIVYFRMIRKRPWCQITFAD